MNVLSGSIKKDKSVIWAFLVILLYSAINIVVLSRHEPWEDEAQAWLIARDLNIISIFKQMGYEGSPALWHMLLVPLAKSGLPYISESILHLVIAVAAVTVFILYAPFSKVTKVLFIFSYYMAYEYSIIARNYNLTILLLFLIAALYAKRFQSPVKYSFLIFLLFNTNVHSFFIAFSLTLLFAWELHRNKILAGLSRIAVFIMLTGGLLSSLQLLSPPDNMNYGIFGDDVYLHGVHYMAPFVAMANAFFPWHTLFIAPGMYIYAVVISFFIFCIVISTIVKKPPALFIFSVSFAGLFYIFAFKYVGFVRHHGFILILLIFSLWISRYYSNSEKEFLNRSFKINLSGISVVVINAFLALSLLCSLRFQYMDYRYKFSGAEEMADFIKKNQLDAQIIIAHRSRKTCALLPYLPEKKFWYAGIEDYGTFITWNVKYLAGTRVSSSQVIRRAGRAFPDKSKILLLLTSPLDFPESDGFRLLYKVDEVFGYSKEKFYLYKSIS